MRNSFGIFFSVNVAWLTVSATHLRNENIHRLAFGSCNNAVNLSPWKLIESFSPNKLILLGDTIYIDSKAYRTKKPIVKLTEAYYDLMTNMDWISLVKKIGGFDNIYAIYDDHDFGRNNCDKHLRFKKLSQQWFFNFTNTSLDSPRRSQDGVYNSHVQKIKFQNTSFLYKVIMLDSRSNKDKKGTIDGDFLGLNQWKWLATELQESYKFDLIILGTSIQLLRTDGIVEESWIEFPNMREKLLKLLSSANTVSNVVILSGDIHHAEVSQANCHKFDQLIFEDPDIPTRANCSSPISNNRESTLWEFTSSGLSHTFSFTTPNRKSSIMTLPNYNRNISLPVISRGFINNFIMNLYQAVSPRPHREKQYGDFYAGLHFAVLDIVPSFQDSSWVLNLSYISHSGTVVINKAINLKRRLELSRSQITSYEKLIHGILAENDDAISHMTSSVCEPYWGKVPMIRHLVQRFLIASLLFTVIVLPTMTVLWFVFASFFYIYYGNEKRRQEKIESYYKKHS